MADIKPLSGTDPVHAPAPEPSVATGSPPPDPGSPGDSSSTQPDPVSAGVGAREAAERLAALSRGEVDQPGVVRSEAPRPVEPDTRFSRLVDRYEPLLRDVR